MNILNNMANAVFSSWNSLFENGGPLANGNWGWVQSLMSVLSTVLWVVLALVGAAGGVYAVYVGIKMARADSAEAREENKKRMINIVVSIVVVIVLIIFFNTFLPMIIGAFTDNGNIGWQDPNGGTNAVKHIARMLIHK